MRRSHSATNIKVLDISQGAVYQVKCPVCVSRKMMQPHNWEKDREDSGYLDALGCGEVDKTTSTTLQHVSSELEHGNFEDLYIWPDLATNKDVYNQPHQHGFSQGLPKVWNFYNTVQGTFTAIGIFKTRLAESCQACHLSCLQRLEDQFILSSSSTIHLANEARCFGAGISSYQNWQGIKVQAPE